VATVLWKTTQMTFDKAALNVYHLLFVLEA
jgi:hypothetical protein